MAGHIQNDFNLREITQNLQTGQAGQPCRIQVSQINIGELLNGTKPQVTNQNNSNVISKEQFTYDGKQGTLIKLDNGTAIFQYKQNINGQEVVTQFRFKKEGDIEKKRPTMQIVNPGKQNQVSMTFEYHRNGQVKNKETKNAKGVVIKQEKFNNKGQVENRKVYDKNGELQQNIKFKRNDKDHTAEVQVYDKNNKLISTAHNQYQEDGKTLVSQEQKYPSGQIKSKIQYFDNGKPQTKVEYYENGQIKAETEYYPTTGAIKTQKQYDEAGNVTNNITPEIDGKFDNSAQVGEGDCYLMATINSIRELDNGQEMLANLVKVSTDANGKKVYTVTLPGAQVAAEGLRTDDRVDPNKMHITGEYTFTEDEMQAILEQAGQRYSLGDGDMILLEAAFEKYRTEVAETLKDNPELKSELGVAGVQTGTNANNILAGGRAEDATFILTGIQSSVYMDRDVSNGLDYTALQNGELNIVPRPKKDTLVKAAVSEIDGKITDDQAELNKMLDQIMNDGNDGKTDLIASAGFRVVHDDGKEGGHRLTIKRVTADSVVMINPWHPDKEVTMTREEFMQCCNSINVADTTKTPMKPEDVNQPTPAPTAGTNPGTSPGVSPGTSPGGPTVTTPPAQGGVSYKVRAGDNLWNIAKAHLGSGATPRDIANYVNKIMDANPNLKWDRSHKNVMIRPGDTINLP